MYSTICQYIGMKIGPFEILDPVPELINPHVLVSIRPWIDVGSSATIALERLEKHFHARELGRISRPGVFYDFTRYRPNVGGKGRRRTVTVPNTVIKYAKTYGGTDLLFLHLLEPHGMNEAYTNAISDMFDHFRISRYCQLGSMYDTVPHTRPLVVTADIGDFPTERKYSIQPDKNNPYQGPTTGISLVTDRLRNMGLGSMMSFMVHIPQYLQLEEDYLGASRLIEALSEVYDIPKRLANRTRGRRQYEEVARALNGNFELSGLIRRLERRYDKFVTNYGLNTRQIILPEVQKFLKEMDSRFGEIDT